MADASQFAPLPNALQASALDRRMNTLNNGMGNSPSFQNFGQNATPANQMGGLGGGMNVAPDPGPIRGGLGNSQGNLFQQNLLNNPPLGLASQQELRGRETPPTGGGNSGPTYDPNNPLSGGTGDPVLDSYLGTDTTYQGQLSDLMKQLDMYNAQKNLTASQTQADYDAKQRALDTQAGLDKTNMLNSYGARGTLNSGIYANSLGQYNQANQEQNTNLLGGLQNSKDNAAMGYNNFVSQELSAKQNAIQQAAARRAAQIGQF